MTIKREQLKIGGTYRTGFIEYTVIAIGGKNVFYKFKRSVGTEGESSCPIEDFLEGLEIAPRPKKRLWIWDIKRGAYVYKSDSYLDEEGKNSAGSIFSGGSPIRKHENEFIEIEVE